MSSRHPLIIFLLSCFLCVTTGCIHEYPFGKGVVPGRIDAHIEINISLRWDEMIQTVSTRTHTAIPHKFIIELRRNSVVVGRDTTRLSDDDFRTGTAIHKLSFPLAAQVYQIAVWYDRDDVSEPHFCNDDFENITLLYRGASTENLDCGYSSDVLDLSGYSGQTNVKVEKQLTLTHAGARFQLETTDIREFLDIQKKALEQGDRFTINIDFSGSSPKSFNLFEERVEYSTDIEGRAGDISLPLGVYDYLVVGSGFIFCKDEDVVSMSVSVYNSARLLVSRTDVFSFPIKRGYNTRVRGDFLTHAIETSFGVDHIWEGEIFIEI